MENVFPFTLAQLSLHNTKSWLRVTRASRSACRRLMFVASKAAHVQVFQIYKTTGCTLHSNLIIVSTYLTDIQSFFFKVIYIIRADYSFRNALILLMKNTALSWKLVWLRYLKLSSLVLLSWYDNEQFLTSYAWKACHDSEWLREKIQIFLSFSS